jgi:hypothetical protein
MLSGPLENSLQPKRLSEKADWQKRNLTSMPHKIHMLNFRP